MIMYDIYLEIIKILGYPQVFDATDDLWDCDIDELAGVIAQTDSEANQQGFFAECAAINEVIESLGYEI